MPEIIPETRGRNPLPESEKKKMVSFRISPQAICRLERYIQNQKLQGNETTKAMALEEAIARLPI